MLHHSPRFPTRIMREIIMEFQVRALQEKDAERVAEMAAALSAHEGMPPPPFDAGF